MVRWAAPLRRLALDTRPFAEPAFRRLLVGQGISWVGYQITAVTVLIQVFDITGSSAWVGAIGLAAFVPLVTFGLYGGAVSDAMDRRLLLAGSATLVWLSTLGLTVQALAGLDDPRVLLSLSVVQATGFAFATPTRGAVIPRLLPRELVPAGNTMISTLGRLGSVVGPLVAGVAVTQGSYALAYGIDLVLYLSMIYAAVRLPRIPPLGGRGRPGLRSVVEGLRYVRTQPILLSSFAIDLIAMVFAMPRALFPQISAERFGGPDQAAWLFAALAAGSVLAGLVSGWISHVRAQGKVLVVAVVCFGLLVAAAGLSPTLWLACVLLGGAGAADLVSSVFRQTILQTYAPDKMRGRMQGTFVVVVVGGPSLGDMRAGASGAALGVTPAWVAGALVSVVLVLAMTWRRPNLYRHRVGDATHDA